MTLLSIYSISGYLAFNEYFLKLSFWISVPTLIAFLSVGVWLLAMWKKEVVYDEEGNVLKIGKTSIKVSDVKDVRVGFFKVEFVLREGCMISFNYPLEDVEILRDLVKGVKK
jgi:hypothetical protein